MRCAEGVDCGDGHAGIVGQSERVSMMGLMLRIV